jgi:hypothetical protein
VRAFIVTRRPGRIAGAASMDDHRVVPCGKPLREFARFMGTDGGRNRFVESHRHLSRVRRRSVPLENGKGPRGDIRACAVGDSRQRITARPIESLPIE